MKTKRSPAPLWGAAVIANLLHATFAHKGRGLLLLGMATTAFAQITLTGRVLMPDSSAVAFANVTLLGEKQQTTASGRFVYEISEAVQKKLGVEIGDDLPIVVEKAGLVVLHPANGRVRIPRKPMSQEIEIIMAKKGSPLLIKSESILEQIIKTRVEEATAAEKTGPSSLRDVVAEEALRLGLDAEQLREAMRQYKERLRTSADLHLRGLAALDDATAAKDSSLKQQKLAQAEQDFRAAIQKDEAELAEAREAESRLPEAYHNLGLTLFNKARYDSAAFYFAKADSAAPNDADKLYMLGYALHKLAQYDRALRAYQHVLEIDTTAHGRNHSNVAIRLNNIGEVLREKGEYPGALEKYNEALKIDEGYFGRNHPKVAIRLNNIAGVLESQGDYAGALENLNEALKIWESAFGRFHPQVATALNNIAGVLESQGDYAGALENLNEALKIWESAFGRVHPQVATALNNIAAVLKSQGDYAGALEKYNEALKIDEGYFGRNHPNVASELNNIGEVFRAQGDYSGALQKYNEALHIVEASFGRSHPYVATTLNNIALVLKEKGDYAGALEKYNEALKIDEGYFGRNHPDVAIQLNNIAGVLKEKGDYAGALEKYDEALAIFMRYLGPDHPNTKTVRENRNQAWWASLSETERWRVQTQSRLSRLRNDPLSVSDKLQLLNSIGVGYIKQANADSALIYLQQALPLAQQLNEQEMLGTVLNNLGSSHKSLKHWAQAKQYLQQSLAHNRSVLGDSASVLAYTYFHLAGVAHAQGQPARGRENAQKSLALAERNKLVALVEEVKALLREMK